MFLIQSLIKNSAGLVQPLGMVRGTSVGEQRGTGDETFSVKAQRLKKKEKKQFKIMCRLLHPGSFLGKYNKILIGL